MSDNPRAAAALRYGRMGWSVLPIHSIRDGTCTCGRSDCASPGKHPLTLHGVLEATTNADTIHHWFDQWPQANLAVACGASKIAVLDVDPRHEGDATFKALVQAHGEGFFDTVRARTGGGGLHFYYADPEGSVRNSQSLIGPGIDTRGAGGFVVAAPSLHVSGNAYSWVAGNAPWDRTMAPVPGFLPRALSAKNGSARSATPISDMIPEGRRNATLASLAGTLRHRQLPAAVVALALKVANQHLCHPPLSEQEVEQIARSITRYPVATDHRARIRGSGADALRWLLGGRLR